LLDQGPIAALFALRYKLCRVLELRVFERRIFEEYERMVAEFGLVDTRGS
jgi:hypothetical protein